MNSSGSDVVGVIATIGGTDISIKYDPGQPPDGDDPTQGTVTISTGDVTAPSVSDPSVFSSSSDGTVTGQFNSAQLKENPPTIITTKDIEKFIEHVSSPKVIAGVIKYISDMEELEEKKDTILNQISETYSQMQDILGCYYETGKEASELDQAGTGPRTSNGGNDIHEDAVTFGALNELMRKVEDAVAQVKNGNASVTPVQKKEILKRYERLTADTERSIEDFLFELRNNKLLFGELCKIFDIQGPAVYTDLNEKGIKTVIILKKGNTPRQEAKDRKHSKEE